MTRTTFVLLAIIAALGAELALTAPPAQAAEADLAAEAVQSAESPEIVGPVEAARMTAGYAVFDRTTGRFTSRRNANKRFRSASIVKLLIALDVLWSRDPGNLARADLSRMTAMLRHSNDGAATHFWAHHGNRQIVLRMARRLKLNNTSPPPPSLRGWWGYTAMTADDTVRIYQYILSGARKSVRDFIMNKLRRATNHGTDGFYQRFGILALPPPRAAKQGWSGFGGRPPAGASIPGLDLRSDLLHTTGTVGRGNRFIMAIFTLHPAGTPRITARNRVTRLTRSLLPSEARQANRLPCGSAC